MHKNVKTFWKCFNLPTYFSIPKLGTFWKCFTCIHFESFSAPYVLCRIFAVLTSFWNHINKRFYRGLFEVRGNPLTNSTVSANDPGIFFLVEDNMKYEMLIMTGSN